MPPHQTPEQIAEALAPARADEPPSGPSLRVPAARYAAMSRDVLRQTHAHDAVERPDAAAAYEGPVATLRLWTRAAPGGAPWTALATSVNEVEGRVAVDAGYRVPADSAEHAAALARDPALALGTLLSRYGLSYYAGRRVYLTPLHVVSLTAPLAELGPDQFARAVGLEEPAPGTDVAVNVASARSRDGLTRLAWLWVLDLTRYEADARARRR
ncbi:hypothetical protein [Miltoncostaea marina]|uniref:hypothetical protein n=1 Tax=Miltoncostaea marina TaxID=2843215 RepID=UPI001C3C9A48|nr:hypothetical protein [Miltoncostaea marina]